MGRLSLCVVLLRETAEAFTTRAPSVCSNSRVLGVECMASNACRLRSPAHLSLAVVAASHVLGVAHGLEMRRIHTARIPAKVIEILLIGHSRPRRDKREPVRQARHVADRFESPVPVSASRSEPDPAPGVRLRDALGPEAFRQPRIEKVHPPWVAPTTRTSEGLGGTARIIGHAVTVRPERAEAKR